MSTVAQLPNPDVEARTFRALARELHVEALERHMAGDLVAYSRLIQKVRELDGRAHDAEIRGARIELQRKAFAGAFKSIFDAVDRQRAAEMLATLLEHDAKGGADAG